MKKENLVLDDVCQCARLRYSVFNILETSSPNDRYLRTMDTANHRGFTIRHDGLQTEVTVRTSQKLWQLYFKPHLYDWHHVCVTWSEASGLRYYENGILSSYTVKYTRVADTPPGTRLIMGDESGDGRLSGRLARLGIWNRQLEQYAIDDIHNFGMSI